jgi:hypothetical protein
MTCVDEAADEQQAMPASDELCGVLELPTGVAHAATGSAQRLRNQRRLRTIDGR